VTSGLLGVAAGLGCVGVGLGVLRGASDFAEPPALGYASRNLRATGASTVEDADFTNSPSSLSFERTSLLVTPSSLASSCTRALPATALLVRVRPAARARATSSYRLTFMASASRLTHDGSTCFRRLARLGKIPCRSCGEPAPPVVYGGDRRRAHPEVIFADRGRVPHPRSRLGATHRSAPCSGSQHRCAPGQWQVRTRVRTPVQNVEPLMSLSRLSQSAEPDVGATCPTPPAER
jgi:hypothetical protein